MYLLILTAFLSEIIYVKKIFSYTAAALSYFCEPT